MEGNILCVSLFADQKVRKNINRKHIVLRAGCKVRNNYTLRTRSGDVISHRTEWKATDQRKIIIKNNSRRLQLAEGDAANKKKKTRRAGH